MTSATLWQILAGLVTIWVLGLGVSPLLRHAQRSAPLPPPNDALSAKWATLTAGDEGGKILGRLERFAFFGAFWADMPLFVGAWLAFKVASKWNVWSNVISVPKTLAGSEEIDFLIARRRWGSQVLMTFLIGTLANAVIGYIGVLVGRHGYDVLRLVCQ